MRPGEHVCHCAKYLLLSDLIRDWQKVQKKFSEILTQNFMKILRSVFDLLQGKRRTDLVKIRFVTFGGNESEK